MTEPQILVGQIGGVKEPLFSIERVVVLLTPIFAGIATWLVAWCATHLPGHPHLDAQGVEGLEIAAFLGIVAVITKWLHGRQELQAQRHEIAVTRLHLIGSGEQSDVAHP